MARDRDVVLDVSVNTAPAEEAIKSFINTSKQFSASLSHAMKLPNNNIEKVVQSLYHAANNYSSALKKLKEVQTASDIKAGQIQEEVARKTVELETEINKQIQKQNDLTKDLVIENQRLEEIKQKITKNYTENNEEAASIQNTINKLKELKDQYKKYSELSDTDRRKYDTTTMRALEADVNKELKLEIKQKEQYAKRKETVKKALQEQVSLLNKKTEAEVQSNIQYQKQENKIEKISRKYDEVNAKILETSDELSQVAAKGQEQLNTLSKETQARTNEIRAEMAKYIQTFTNLGRELPTGVFVEMLNKPLRTLIEFNTRMKDYQGGTNEYTQKLIKMSEVAKMLASDFKKLVSTIGRFIKFAAKLTGIAVILRGIRGYLRDTNRMDWKKGLRYIIQYGFGFRSLFFLVRRLRSAFVDAMTDMGKAIEPIQGKLDIITSASNRLRNSMATALAPLLDLVANLMERLASVAVKAANSVAQFFAVLTGQDVWYEMSDNAEDYVSALEDVSKASKEAENQLAHFDEMDVLKAPNDTGSGSSSSLEEYIGKWTPANNPFSKLADMIKEAWGEEDVVKSFENVGRYISEGLTNALNNVLTTFWPNISKTAIRIAGSIAGTINGAVATPDLAIAIAKNIAAAINTALSTLSTYWGSVKWDEVGNFIYSGLRTLFGFNNSGINWDVLGNYLAKKIQGTIEFAAGIVGDGAWITDIGSRLSDIFSKILETVDFKQLGSTINTVAMSILTAISDFLTQNGSTIGDKFGEFLEGLQLQEIALKISEVMGKILELGGRLLLETLLSNPWLFRLLGEWLLFEFGKIKITNALSGLMAKKLEAVAGKEVVKEGLVKGMMKSMYASFKSIAAWVGGSMTATIGLAVTTALLSIYDLSEWNKAASTYNEAQQTFNKETEQTLSTYSKLYEDKGKEVADTWAKMVYDIDLTGQSYEEAQKSLAGRIEKLWGDTPMNMWEGFKQGFDKYFSITGGSGFIGLVIDAFGDKGLLGKIKSIFKIHSPSEVMRDIGINLIEGLLLGLTSLPSRVSEVFESAKKTITNILDSLKTAIKTPINGIIGMVNGLVSGLVSGINACINALNKIKVNVPYWVPVYGGRSFGFNIGKLAVPKIPYLASGAVIPPNKPFMAMLGDQKQGTNIEAPLDTMVEAFKQALDQYGGGNGTPVNLVVDGKTLATTVIKWQNKLDFNSNR